MKRMCLAAAVASMVAVSAVAGEGAGWLTDFAKAKQESAARNVPILADFSGSDWCGWCIKLDKEVFSTETFQKYAATNLVLLLVDFPNKKKLPPAEAEQNKKLAADYGIRGYPTVLLLNPDGSVIGKTGYQPGGPEKYIAHLDALKAQKPDAGAPGAGKRDAKPAGEPGVKKQ